MKVKRAQNPSALLFVLGLILLTGCGEGTRGQMGRELATNVAATNNEKEPGGREAALGERFTLNPDEKVSIKGTQLTLKLKGVRRSWLANGGGEFAEAEILVTSDGKEQSQWMKVGAEITAGDYQVKLWGANPFGKTNAELEVTAGRQK